MLHYPITKQFCFGLCTVKCDLESEGVTRANPSFFKNETLNLGQPWSTTFAPLYRMNWRNSWFFFAFAKQSPFTSLRKMLESTLLSKFTVPNISIQVSSTPNCLLFGFVFFGGQYECPWTFPSIKNTNLFVTFLSASSISSTMHDILVQKSTESKNESWVSFIWKQTSIPFTWPSKLELCPHPIL